MNQKGITLIEIVVMVALIAIFSSILISDFPKMQRQFMLSRTAHKLVQDIRRAQDLALSGHRPEDGDQVAGYGIYFDTPPTTQYIIYKDNVVDSVYDKKYNAGEDIEPINISDFAIGVHIKEINGDTITSATSVSINFTPPNPLVTITVNSTDQTPQSIEIVLASDDDSLTKSVKVNKAGLIEIQ